MAFYMGCHQEVMPTFRVGLPAWNDPIRRPLSLSLSVNPRFSQVDTDHREEGKKGGRYSISRYLKFLITLYVCVCVCVCACVCVKHTCTFHNVVVGVRGQLVRIYSVLHHTGPRIYLIGLSASIVTPWAISLALKMVYICLTKIKILLVDFQGELLQLSRAELILELRAIKQSCFHIITEQWLLDTTLIFTSMNKFKYIFIVYYFYFMCMSVLPTCM